MPNCQNYAHELDHLSICDRVPGGHRNEHKVAMAGKQTAYRISRPSRGQVCADFAISRGADLRNSLNDYGDQEDYAHELDHLSICDRVPGGP